MATTTAKKPRASGSQRTTAKASTITIPQLSWDQIRPAPIVLVSGAESFLADRAITLLRDFLRSEDSALEVHDLFADSYPAGSLVTLASPSLFGEPRLIRIRSVEKCSDVFMKEVDAYIDTPAAGAYLVLRHGGGVRGKRLLERLRSLPSGAVEIVCSPLKRESDRYAFAAAEFTAVGRRIVPAALRALVAAFSEDLAELAAGCQQLISDTEGEITRAVVDRYYGGRMNATAFAVADSAIAGRYGDALVALRHALSCGTDPVPIVAAFGMKIRTMAKVYGMRGSSQQVASNLGLVSWQVEKAHRDLQGWTSPGLQRCVSLVAETDADVKGGSRDAVFALERMVSIVSSRGAGR